MVDLTAGGDAAASFQAHRKAQPEATFTGWLHERAGETWSQATRHRFVEAMWDGSIPDEVYRAYLVQDHAFVLDLVDLLGHAVATAPTIEAKRPFIAFLELVTSDENTYFQRAFDALEVSEADRVDPELGEATQRFAQLMREAGNGSYADALSVLYPVEAVYLDWGQRLARDPPRDWVLRDWIDLHANPGFEAFVGHMRAQLDRVGEQASPAERARLAQRFQQAVELEVDFWEQAYELA